MRALILVDLQNDFLPGGALAVQGGDSVVPVANRLQHGFDLVVATQDWHPPDHGSFAANHPGARVGQWIELGGLEQVLWPVHCVEGTRGAELAPGLDTSRIERVFRKGCDPGVDSYSGFYDNGRSLAERLGLEGAAGLGASTGLEEFLRARGVREVYIGGLATDYCVLYTALDAVGLGLRTFLVEDCCRAVDLEPGDEERALEEMRRAGVEIVSSFELLPTPLSVGAEALAAGL